MKKSPNTDEVSLRSAKGSTRGGKIVQPRAYDIKMFPCGGWKGFDYGPRRQKYHENAGNNHLKTVNIRSNGKSRVNTVMNETGITVFKADLALPDHQEAVLQLLSGYASDPMGDGKPLSEQARRDLIPRLRQHPTTLIFLVYEGAVPVGLAICFLGFSTFAARPLVNIHDFYVIPSCRGTGVSRSLMQEIDRYARELGCCKLTLEVLENNHRARSIYAAAGFGPSTYTPEAGSGLFLVKSL